MYPCRVDRAHCRSLGIKMVRCMAHLKMRWGGMFDMVTKKTKGRIAGGLVICVSNRSKVQGAVRGAGAVYEFSLRVGVTLY